MFLSAAALFLSNFKINNRQQGKEQYVSLVTRHSSLVVFSALGMLGGPPVFAQENVGVDPPNMGWSAELIDGQLSGVAQRAIPAEAFSAGPNDAGKPVPDLFPGPREKVHPELAALIKSRPAADLVEVVVVFEEDTKIPPMPFLKSSLPREDATNAARLRDVETMIDGVKAARLPKQAAKASMLSRDFGGRTLDNFWLINGVVVELPLSAMNGLAQRPDVLSIEPKQKTVPPPTHGPANHVSNARTRIGTDVYFNLNLTSGYIGLLDTGVRPTHSLLSGPDHIDFELDCTGGDANGICNSLPNPQDTWNHGVSSAAILTGNNNMNNPFRGVTAITVDSFKIYGTCNGCGLDTSATVTAFQHAVTIGDRVIVAEIQDITDHNGATSLAADAAFDANRIVVAAAGNYGPSAGTVSAPGNAHKALAIGAYDVVSANLESYSGRGPTSDGRYKPDVTLPTNTLTASNVSDTATRIFGGTSGATPYGAGAAMLFSNWYARAGTTDAGHVYALMIAAGGNTATNNAYDNNEGAGRLSWPPDNGGLSWWKVTVSNGQLVNLTFPINTVRRNLKAAIWWPEASAQSNSDIDLFLRNPSGVSVASSTRRAGVFEKVNVVSGTALPQGTWTVRLQGVATSTPYSRTVYVVLRQADALGF